MTPLTEAQIRASFINATRSERGNLTLPDDFDSIRWDRLDFFGWRDKKFPGIGYVIVELDGTPTGILLRQSDGRTRTRPQCSWCADVLLPNEVVFFSTKRSGAAGRRGDTIGTLVCSHFECNENVRKLPPVAYLGFDREAARDRRIDALQQSVRGFVRDVRDGR